MPRPEGNDQQSEQVQKIALFPVEEAILGANTITSIKQDPSHSDMALITVGTEKYPVVKLKPEQVAQKLEGRRHAVDPTKDSMGILVMKPNQWIWVYKRNPDASTQTEEGLPIAQIVRDSESNYHINVFRGDGTILQMPPARKTLLVGSNPKASPYYPLLPNADIAQTVNDSTISRIQIGIKEISVGQRAVFIDNLGMNPIFISQAMQAA